MTGVSECSQQRGNLKDDGYTSKALGMIPKGGSVPKMICVLTRL
ncbi:MULTISPECIES: hypothetical protein [Photorhabdus]|nr:MULTISPECIES: hypothetical protein [Photorhabdus]